MVVSGRDPVERNRIALKGGLMLPHHETALENVRRYFEPLAAVEAVFLAGSIAHGYAIASSDVDILIVCTDDDYQSRKERGELLFYNEALAGCEGCYIDGKYVNRAVISLVAEKGNEPTRFAYKNLVPILCRDPEIHDLVQSAGRYPQEKQERNSRKFYSHMRAWMWFFHEAKKKDNLYLETRAVSEFVFYASRALLAANARLYPFHKWLLAELACCDLKPDRIIERFELLLKERRTELIEEICADVQELRDWGVGDRDWPGDFYDDVESVWMRQDPFIADW